MSQPNTQEVIVPPTDEEINNAASVVENSLNLLTNIIGQTPFPGGAQLSQTDTMYLNNRWYLISNNRTLLNQMYVEHGIVQTLVDQPVEDAFRNGFEIKSGQLSPEDIEDLEVFCEEHKVIDAVVQGMKWARLFGGGGFILISDQKADTPLNIETLKEDTRFEFRPFDLWEIQSNTNASQAAEFDDDVEFYYYYNVRIHKSRVFRMKGKEAPSIN